MVNGESEEVSIDYTCSMETGCTEAPGPDCEACKWTKTEVKTTRRNLADCAPFNTDPRWQEVYMVDGPQQGQAFFYGTHLIKADGEHVLVLGERVAVGVEVHACQDDYAVRHFVAKVQLIASGKVV